MRTLVEADERLPASGHRSRWAQVVALKVTGSTSAPAMNAGFGVVTACTSALQRADEPAELLGYWLTRHGRNVPMPIDHHDGVPGGPAAPETAPRR